MLWWQAHRCLCAVRSTGPTAASHRMCNDTDHTALNCCRSRERLSRVACASNHQRMSTYHDSAAKTPGTSVIQMRTNVGHCSLRLRWLKQRPRGLRSLPTVTQHFAFFLFFSVSQSLRDTISSFVEIPRPRLPLRRAEIGLSNCQSIKRLLMQAHHEASQTDGQPPPHACTPTQH